MIFIYGAIKLCGATGAVVFVPEEWKSIEGYEGLYEVSNMGRVKSLARIWKTGLNLMHSKSDTILKPIVTNRGYNSICLYNKGIAKIYRTHRLVATHFVLQAENKPHINHLNGIKTDNRANNLEWVTNSGNISHAWDIGLRDSCRGADHPFYGIPHGDHPCAKMVIDIKTGAKYESAKDAAKEIGMKYKTLLTMLVGHRRNKTNLKYIES